MTSPTVLTAAQQALVALLGRPEQPPTFAAGLGEELQAELEDELAPVASVYTPADPLWVSKHALAMVHGCEAHYVDAERRPFTWTVAAARGTVAHKAIELSVHWRGEAPPMDLVDEAIARLIQADGAGAPAVPGAARARETGPSCGVPRSIWSVASRSASRP